MNRRKTHESISYSKDKCETRPREQKSTDCMQNLYPVMLLAKYRLSCTANYLHCASRGVIGLWSTTKAGTLSLGMKAAILAWDSILLKCLIVAEDWNSNFNSGFWFTGPSHCCETVYSTALLPHRSSLTYPGHRLTHLWAALHTIRWPFLEQNPPLSSAKSILLPYCFPHRFPPTLQSMQF